VDKLIEHFVNQSCLARALKVDPAAVSQWLSAERIPPRRAIEIEMMTGGKFKAVDLIGGYINDKG
jgi:DNA-binding transcriptional regulator YdaS (Cro superfamily)